MFIKRVGNGVVVSGSDESVEKFAKGSKFLRDNSVWRIVEEEVKDSLAWRKLISNTGTEEVIQLKRLQSQLNEGEINLIEEE